MAKARYDSPIYQARHLMHIPLAAGSGGTSGRHAPAVDILVRNVMAVVHVAGTSAGHGHTIRVGTNSIGTLAMGTTAINGTVSSGDLKQKVSKGQVLNFLNGTDATGVSHVSIEYQIAYDADVSAD
jgi:hypothetical protein